MTLKDGSGSGLFVHRASRTERLAEELAEAIEAAPPDNPLATQTIVIAHPGLRRWLLGVFARRKPAAGGHGIAANFDMIQPWQWLERTAEEVLGEGTFNAEAYRREMLRWVIHRVLPQIDAEPVKAYLATPDRARRRFQLAEHLAGLYSQYLVYRPDWILAWERGDRVDGLPPDDWQASLWRHLRRHIAQPHRAQRRVALVQALSEYGDGRIAPLRVFGISHLPPDVLDALHAISMHREVHLYFPDPCRHYWADLRTPREILRLNPDADDLYYEVGHPLLVSLGRMAQEFFIRLDQLNADLSADEPDTDAEHSLLLDLQESIRDCLPDRFGCRPALVEDNTLRIHACHTRLREIEVLKDALLDFLAKDNELQHRDIVVMAPDIAAYAPYLRAVFGEPASYGDERDRVPWHLADVRLASTHPVFGAFARLLDLADSRFTVSDVFDLLDAPALARRFDFDVDTRATLERLLRESHVAWGLDADMKAATGAAKVGQNSWSFGLDRLYAGWIAGDEQGAPGASLLDGILPAQGVGGGEAEVIGRLDHLIEALRHVRDSFGVPRSLADWRDFLLELFERFFIADAYDTAESNALRALRRRIADFGEQAEATGRDPIAWEVMREAMRICLDEVSERQAFLLGGVTFCGLVPQRSIPFKVVCLLGMNDGEFPRRNSDIGLNRMLMRPRRSDRDTRSEDRYLFLEALMAARRHLHISYLGEGVRDGKPRNPATPLAELLQFLNERHGLSEKDYRPWLVKHPLQPFDARYFDARDPRLFTYDRAFEHLTGTRSVPAPFMNFADQGKVSDTAAEVSLAALKRFWRNPARALLRDGAGLSLDVLDRESWPDREPLEGRIDRRFGIERHLLSDALSTGRVELPEHAPAWLGGSGTLPTGSAGTQAYASARDPTQAVLDLAMAYLGPTSRACPMGIDLDLDEGIRLTGEVDSLRSGDAGLCVFGAKPFSTASLGDLLPFYIDYACARLGSAAEVDALFIEYVKSLKIRARVPKLLDVIRQQDPDQLQTGLRRLVETARRPALLLPLRTAWAWMNAQPGEREAKAREVWEGRFQSGESDYDDYAALLARDSGFLDIATPAHARFEQACKWVAEVLDPNRDVLLHDGARTSRRKKS